MSEFVLKIMTREGLIACSIELTAQKYTIGRKSENDVTLLQKFISKHHCTLILTPSEIHRGESDYVIWDGKPLGASSTNGTWVNGRAINKKRLLRSGDTITFTWANSYPQLIFKKNETDTDCDGTYSQEFKK